MPLFSAQQDRYPLLTIACRDMKLSFRLASVFFKVVAKLFHLAHKTPAHLLAAAFVIRSVS